MHDDDRRQALQIAQLAAYLQRAAAMAHELGDIALSRRLYDLSEEQRQRLPVTNPDWRYEHPDERRG